ncbi:MAG: hypothetical protein J0L52_10595 [Caulobacterales bacterium]|nr:hypothetical protein [Caulobacterales bacterium]
MTQEAKRQRRRRDAERMKAKARRIRPDQPTGFWRADYLAVCSCAMCGNPRHVWKAGRLTRQERKAGLQESDES